MDAELPKATMAGHFKTGLDTIMPMLIRFGKWVYDNKPALVIAIAVIGLAITLALGPVSLACPHGAGPARATPGNG